MNFVSQFKAGQAGFNRGLPTGISKLDKAINGLQKKTSIGVCAAPKCGKTTFADFAFLISPYLYMEKMGLLDDVEWIYFSGEIDRISKEFKVASFFMHYDYGIDFFTFQGKEYPMNQDYLMGKQLYVKEVLPSGEEIQDFIPINPDDEVRLKEIYTKRIIPMFGEYDAEGNQIQKGKIIFIEEADNPTGMYKYLLNYARLHGEFKEERYETLNDHGQKIYKTRIIGYKENNPKKFTIVITDHVRKLVIERGFTLKQNIDKWLEYTTILRNRCLFTFINIAHSNRGIANVDRLKYAGEFVYPTADDVKDSGNLAEESTILMTLFNPNDEKYNLERHMGIDLSAYPNYRSIHITESRYTECPAHIQLNMFGGINYFTPLFPNF